MGAAAAEAVRGARGQAEPAVRLLDDGGFRLSYETGYGRRAVRGTLSSGGVQWDAEAQPASGEDAQFHPAHAIRGGHEVSVVAVPRGNEETEQLVYGTEATPTAAISYEQLAFVEAQWLPPVGSPDEVGEEQRFVATKASADRFAEWARKWREAGRVVRLWGFAEAHVRWQVDPNFPAADDPRAGWYRQYLQDKGSVE